MTWTRPTLAQIRARIEGDLVTALALAGQVLRVSMLRVIARVVAGASHMLHGHGAYNVDQILPDKCDEPNLGRHTYLKNFPRNEASFAEGAATFTGTNGSAVATGTEVYRDDGSGVGYRVTTDAVVAGGVVVLALEALAAGVAGNAGDGTSLTFASAPAGLTATGEATGDLEGGANRETVEAWRVRFIQFLRSEQRGGHESDYEVWAQEVEGVTRVWVTRFEAGILGTITVRFVRDGDGTGAAIIPSAGEVTAVADYIESKRPGTATVILAAPTDSPITFSISGVAVANQAAVALQLDDLFYRQADPNGTVISLAEMRTAIGTASPTYTLVSPVADIAPAVGTLPTRSTITWP